MIDALFDLSESTLFQAYDEIGGEALAVKVIEAREALLGVLALDELA
mgnify:CR=1 FL=1